jgi:hypothetical protein
MKLSQIVLHLGNVFVTFGSTELRNKTVLYVTDQKVFVIKLLTPLLVFVMLWRNSIESVLSMLCH